MEDSTTKAQRFLDLATLAESHLAPEWRLMLYSLRNDTVCPETGQIYCGLENAPAGKANHHAREGGLVEHYLEMWEFWRSIPLPHHLAPGAINNGLDSSHILAGIILHDLHKAWCTFTVKRDGATGESTFEYGDHLSGRMMTDDVKSMYIATSHTIKLPILLVNALFCSEGGWAKNPPRYCSVLAKYLYLLDELSGNVFDRMKSGTYLNVRELRTLVPLDEVLPGISKDWAT